ncbi:MAG: glycosyltransferase family 2 protein [Mariprofundaceae bacterium]
MGEEMHIDAGEMNGLSIVVPVYNEVNAALPEIQNILKIMEGLDCPCELIVVDDGSQDGTADLLRQANEPFQLIASETNCGYGASLKKGIRQAKYPIVAITDADGTYPNEEIPVLMDLMRDADMVVGARTGDKVHIPLIRRPAKWALNQLANYLSNADIPDLNSGLRLFRKNIAERYFHILPSRFSFTTTITLAMFADGYRVRYHAIDYHKREGSSKIKPSDAIGFFILILRTITYFSPLRTFVPLFLALASVGSVKLIYDVFILQNITDTTTFILMSALQVILIGVVADLIVRRGESGR